MKFKKGVSGNPSGRNKGSLDWRGKLRQELEMDAPEIMRKLIAQAKGGDIQAAKIVIDKVYPNIKSESIPVSIQIKGDTITQKAETIIDHAASGELSIDAAVGLLSALGSVVRIKEVEELEARIRVLENHSKIV